jgi:hypothetical protein
MLVIEFIYSLDHQNPVFPIPKAKNVKRPMTKRSKKVTKGPKRSKCPTGPKGWKSPTKRPQRLKSYYNKEVPNASNLIA